MKKLVLLIANLNNNINIAASSLIREKILSELNTGNYHSIILFNSDKVFGSFPETRTLTIKSPDTIFSSAAILGIPSLDGEVSYYSSVDIDHILPTTDFAIHFAGIDFNESLSNAIVALSDLRYNCTVNTSLVKTYKNLTYKNIRNHCRIENK